MGTGVHVPRPLTGLAALLVLSGCIDFVEPDLPERGAPAVLEARVQIGPTDSVAVAATLVPGLDEGGFRRRVTVPALTVLDRRVDPDVTRATGTREYRGAWAAADTTFADGVLLAGPLLDGLAAPAVRWYTVRRRGPATFGGVPGEELEIPLTITPGTSAPAPGIRQWFLTLVSDGGVFRLSADGPPPATIPVPPRWVPAGDTVRVTLVYQQSVRLEAPGGEYIALITLDTRLAWTVRHGPAPGED